MNIEFVTSRYILYCGAPFEGAPQYISYKLDAHLRSPRLSVGSKLCFCACVYLSFFMQLLISPEAVSLGMAEVQISHICKPSWKRHSSCSKKTFF